MINIGEAFVARKSYPFIERGRKTEDFSYDIKTGEKVLIQSKDGNLYKLVNLSLEEDNAWVMVPEEDVLKLQRKGETK